MVDRRSFLALIPLLPTVVLSFLRRSTLKYPNQIARGATFAMEMNPISSPGVFTSVAELQPVDLRDFPLQPFKLTDFEFSAYEAKEISFSSRKVKDG